MRGSKEKVIAWFAKPSDQVDKKRMNNDNEFKRISKYNLIHSPLTQQLSNFRHNSGNGRKQYKI